MPFDLAAARAALVESSFDAWLLTDFRGSNAPARRILGAPVGSRRWWYLIPRSGEPLKIEPSVEPGILSMLPGRTVAAAAREDTDNALRPALASVRSLAMEYSPLGVNPYVSHVDAGTLERVRMLLPAGWVVSSQDLLQRFDALWTSEQWQTHLAASKAVMGVIDAAVDLIRQGVARNSPVSEYDVTAQSVRLLKSQGLTGFGDSLNTSNALHARLPHYAPPPPPPPPHPRPGSLHASASAHPSTSSDSADAAPAPLTRGQLVLLDYYARLKAPTDAVYADYTRVFFVGSRRSDIPARWSKAFDAVVAAREAVVTELESACKAGRPLHGKDLDTVARNVLIAAGYEAHIAHRTGHNLGSSHVHGNGAHLDAVEHPDDRLLLPNSAFTIEPGLYFEDFGVRTEINAYLDPHYHPHLTGHRADHIELIEL